MKPETLVHQHPPTPPTVTTELQYGLHHIAQHNANGNYQLDDSQLTTQNGSAYGTPAPMLHEGVSAPSTQHYPSQHVDASQFSDSHPPDFGLGIHYDNFGDGSNFFPPEGQYNGLPENHAMFSGSPPTPSSAIENEGPRHTRSGRPIVPTSSPAQDKPRPKAAPKSRKAKQGKSDKPKTPKLTAPLSILTKDYANIPVRDMKEWVNRPAEVRRKEVEKRNGYVTRPMNSFMLYRSAYAERTKQWCLQNNHQVVSSVSGESWPMEPAEVRELYNEYAKIERINHQNAHPTYKFSPSKATAPSKKKRGEFSDEEPSDLEDAEWNPGHHRSKARPPRRQDRSAGYPSNAMNTEFFDRSFGPNDGINKSAWEMTNGGKPMPLPMGHNDLYHQYFQTTVHPSMSMAGLEDLRLRRVDSPGSMQFSHGHPLLGLPGGNANDLIQQLHSQAGTPLGEDPQVDPMLLAYDGVHHNDNDPAMGLQQDFSNGNLALDRELDQASVNSLLGMSQPQDDFHNTEAWHADPTIAPMEAGSEFDKWMDDHHVN